MNEITEKQKQEAVENTRMILDHPQILDVLRERRRQTELWGDGTPKGDLDVTGDRLLTITTEELGEVAKEVTELDGKSDDERDQGLRRLRIEACQLAACGLKLMEWAQKEIDGDPYFKHEPQPVEQPIKYDPKALAALKREGRFLEEDEPIKIEVTAPKIDWNTVTVVDLLETKGATALDSTMRNAIRCYQERAEAQINRGGSDE